MLDWPEYLKLVAGLASIVNPVGVIPIFLSLTDGQDQSQRRFIAVQASFALCIVLVSALVAGEAILSFFSIGLPSFRVAGGLLILLTALSMLKAETAESRQLAETGTVDPNESPTLPDAPVAVVPIAIPLLGGPGAISTVIVYAHTQESMEHNLLVGLAILSVSVIALLGLLVAPLVDTVMGKTGMNVISRVMGLIITAISIEFIADGVKELLPGLG
ncbi:MarC family protein [Acaryochloris sp. IP29b_bin.148]|uniref:MarC family protein n=1 Tax=Acaryochloris sp. IP29b_bin.148 TaxID=2969218 RepID=UPI002630616C|nr:MarC family protein [Acaryochloris sp. IP29b_bin.148]